MNGLEHKVEVCVSDNSTDGLTEPVLRQYVAGGTFKLTYIKNEKNLGYDKNVAKALSLGRGRYLHLLSDEDMYDERALVELISILEKEKPDCILLSMHLRKHVKADMGIFRVFEGDMLPRMFSLKGKGMMFFGLLSCVLIRRETYEDFVERFGADRFYGLGYLHVPIYLWALRQAKKTVAYGKDYRTRENVNDSQGRPVAAFPSDQLDFVCRNYFQTITISHSAGVIDDADYALFKRNYLNFVLYILFENRTLIYPGIFQRESGRIRVRAAEFLKEYRLNDLKRGLISAYINILYIPWVPYHWIYRVWAWYRISVRKDKDVMDAHDAYQSYLAGTRKFDTLAERTYET